MRSPASMPCSVCPTATPAAILTKNLNGSISAQQFLRSLNGSPAAVIQSNGSFRFKPVRQGTYDLVWGTIRKSDGAFSFTFTYHVSDNTPVYVALVGPLCAFEFGAINEFIPTPQSARIARPTIGFTRILGPLFEGKWPRKAGFQGAKPSGGVSLLFLFLPGGWTRKAGFQGAKPFGGAWWQESLGGSQSPPFL